MLERYLLTGEPPSGPDPLEVEIATASLHRLPTPPVAKPLVERHFYDKELAAPVPIRGIIDLIEPHTRRLADGRECLIVTDHKTTSHLKWAKTNESMALDFQVCVYTCHVQRLLDWPGPIEFRLSYSTTKPPILSEIRSCIFEPEAIQQAAAFVRQTLHAMWLTSMLQDVRHVPYNLSACGDYKSKTNPMGCPHRERCAALGRSTMGVLSVFYQES
jgi:hypothetical protein